MIFTLNSTTLWLHYDLKKDKVLVLADFGWISVQQANRVMGESLSVELPSSQGLTCRVDQASQSALWTRMQVWIVAGEYH